MRRIVTVTALGLGVLVPATSSGQQDDRGRLERLIEDNLSAEGMQIDIEGFRGALSSEAQLESLTISDDTGTWLEMRGVVLDWNRTALLRGRVSVNALTADEIVLNRLPGPNNNAPVEVPDAAAEPFSLPELPVSLQIGEISAERVELGSTVIGQPVEFRLEGSASLAGGEGEAALNIERTDGTEGTVSLEGSYSNESNELALSLLVDEAPGGIVASLAGIPGEPALNLSVDGQGPLTDFTADLALATDGEDRLAGQVEIAETDGGARGFNVAIDGDIRPLLTPENREFFGPNLSLDVVGQRFPSGALQVDTLDLQSDAITLTGDLILSEDQWPVRFSLQGNMQGPDGGRVALPIPGQETLLDRAEIDVAYDSESGNGWTADIEVAGLDREGLTAESFTLTGDGTLVRGGGETQGGASGAIEIGAEGLEFSDEDVAQAVGRTLSGVLNFDWTEGQPLAITGIDLDGAGVAAEGAVEISGLTDDLNIVIAPDLRIAAEDISRFSGVAGRDLAGGIDVQAQGTYEPVSGAFDMAVNGDGTGIETGIPEVDGLIAGQIDLAIDAARDETGITLRGLDVQSETLSVTAEGTIADTNSDARFDIAIDDISRVRPELSGPVNLQGTVAQEGDDYTLDVTGNGPGGARIDADVTATVIENVLQAVSGNGDVQVDTLGTFSQIAGRELAGAVSVSGSGSYNLDTGAASADVTGSSNDLAVGIDEVDALFDGQAQFTLDGSRDGDGNISLRALDLTTPRASITANGSLQQDGSQARFDISLSELGQVVEGLSGSAQLSGTASQDGEEWTFDVTGNGPGGVAIDVDGTAEAVGMNLQAIAASGDVSADDLAPYSELAQRELGGSLRLSGEGSYTLDTQFFSADVTGQSTDLAVGIAEVNAILEGQTTYEIDAERNERGIIVDTLDVQSPRLSITGDGVYSAENSRANFDATIDELSDIVEGMSGSATLQGSAQQDGDRLSFDVTGSGPGGANADIEGTATLDQMNVTAVEAQGTLGVDSLSPYSELAGRELGGSASFDGAGSYDLQTQFFTADLTGETRDIVTGIEQADALLEGTTTMDVDAARDENGIAVRTLDIRNPQITVTGEGVYAETGSRAEFDATIAELSEIVPGMTGGATVQGTAEQDGDAVAFDVTGSGPGGAGIDLTGNATLDGTTPTTVAAEGSVAIDNLGAYSPLAGRELAGRARFEGSGEVDLETYYFDADVTGTSTDIITGIEQADTLLAGTVNYDVDATRNDEGIVIDTLRIVAPRASVTANGTYAAQNSDLTFQAQMQNLADVVDGLNGAASIDGQATQTGPETWDLTLDAQGPGGAAADIDGTARVVDLMPERIEGSGTVSVGNLAPYGAVANLNLGGAVTVEGSGAYTLDTGAFEANADGRATNLRTGIAAADQLLGGTTTFGATASRGATGPIVIDRLVVDGSQIDASVDGTYGPNGGSLDYDLRLANLGLFVPELSGPVTATGSADITGQGYQLNTAVTGPGGIDADISGSIAQDFGTANLSADGVLPLGVANPFIEPNILTGNASFSLGVNGPLALSSVSGQVNASGAEFVLPSQGIIVQGIDATVALSGGQANIDLTGGLSTGGTLTVSGPVTLSGGFNGDLAIALNELQVVDPGLYETIVNGQLSLTGPLASTATLAGTIDVGRTEVRVPSGGPSAGSLSFNIDHVNEPADVRATRARAGLLDDGSDEGGDGSGGGGGGVNYGLDLTISAPAQIFVRGRGLDAELGGELQIGGTLQNPVPQGRFDLIRGRLDILGQRITLSEAYVQLLGDFNPFIYVRADTQRDENTISIIIEGPVNDPEVTFQSTPDRPEEEVLALLLFGRDLSEISGLQALRIAAAVNTLAGNGGGGILENLRQSTGLDDIDIQTGADGQTELRVGRYINERAYTDVTVNSAGETEINLNLTVTPNITARGTATSTGNTGVGIYYERDY
ncbi:hypothetical protein ATO8_14822 [Roseivivax marinus]|uniref:Translocation and assembly module TamB C-terminal domain-containing protein n=1 Tax=Roseivivax marinus TaxID=1379903 RepID=W4HGX7_9RHOB|nr:translocation/assembly module TamB domain-containing protein [Roseivivax marinus]ETW11949.1 hypothetical protein ATO8_14822 [Roseivivax marinus]